MKTNTSNYKPYLILSFVFAYLVIFPTAQTRILDTLILYDNKRLGEALLFTFVSILMIGYKPLRTQVAAQIFNLCTFGKAFLILLLVSALVSTFIAPYTEWAVLELSHTILLVLSIFLVASVVQEIPDQALILLKWATIGMVCLYLLKFMIGYALHLSGAYPLWPGTELQRGISGFANKRFFNHVQTWTIPLLLIFIWREKNAKLKVFFLVVTSFWLMLMIASSARGTFVGVAGAIIIISIYLREGLKNLWIEILKSGVIASLLYVLFFRILVHLNSESLLDRFMSHGVQGRGGEWLSALPVILDNPVFGVGPMHYASAFYENWGHPHNWFIQIAYEMGIPTAVFASILIGMGIYKFARQIKIQRTQERTPEIGSFKVGLLWSLLAATIHGLLSGIIVMPLSQVWLILIVGFAMGLYVNDDKVAEIEKLKVSRYSKIVLVLIIASLSGYFYWCTQHSTNTDIRRAEYVEKYEGNDSTIRPRFWGQGKFGF